PVAALANLRLQPELFELDPMCDVHGVEDQVHWLALLHRDFRRRIREPLRRNLDSLRLVCSSRRARQRREATNRQHSRKRSLHDPLNPCPHSLSPFVFVSTGSGYGARNRRIALASASLSDARTRICITTVPLMRGDNSCGALWQRLQFCWNFCSPAVSIAVFAGFCPVPCSPLCACRAC